MNKEQKSQIIEEISQDLANYSHVYVTDISGFTVSTVNQLRKLCFSKDVKLKVVKNTLLKRAMDASDKDYSELYETLNGPTAIMLCNTGNHGQRPREAYQGLPGEKREAHHQGRLH